MRASLTVVASALLVVALSACTTVPPASSPTPSPSASASGAPEPIGVPGSRLPGDCEDLLPLAEAAAFVGDDAKLAASQPFSSYTGTAALAQSGLTECGWGGGNGDLTVVALAEGDSLYRAHLDAAAARGYVAGSVLSGTVGERESSQCYGEAEWSHCEVDFASNGYWVTIFHNLSTSIAEVEPALTALAQRVDARLGDLGPPLPRFEQSVSRDGTETCPAGLDPAGSVFAASGVATGYGPQDEGSGDGLAIWYRAQAEAGHLSCTWTGQSDLFFSFWLAATPGSGWVWPDVVAAHPEAEAVVVPGASQSFGYCDENQCWVEALVGDTWMQGSLGTYPDRGLDDVVVALAAAIPLVTATFTP